MAKDLTQKIKGMNQQITTLTFCGCGLYLILSVIFIYNLNPQEILNFLKIVKKANDVIAPFCLYSLMAFVLIVFNLHNVLDSLFFVRRKSINLFIANKLLEPVNQKISKKDSKREGKKIRILMGIFYDLIERDSWEEKAFHDWGIYFSSVNFAAVSYLGAILFGSFVLLKDIDLTQDITRSVIIIFTNIILPFVGRLMIINSTGKLFDIAEHQTTSILKDKSPILRSKLMQNGILINAS